MTVAELFRVLQQFKPDMQVIAELWVSGYSNAIIGAHEQLEADEASESTFEGE